MRSRTFQHPTRDVTLLAGWLFADLFLGLMVVFLAAVPPITIPPILTVNTKILKPNDGNCNGDLKALSCHIVLSEMGSSKSSVDWTASSDMSDNVAFSPASGTLSPGHSVQINLSNFPCQNGSFTFSGSHNTLPVTIRWLCTPPIERLDFNPQEFSLTVQDINGLLNDSPSAIADVKQQIKKQTVLSGKSAGLAIVYGGAPDDSGIGLAQQIADKVYNILQSLGKDGFIFQRSSNYKALYVLGVPSSTVTIDVYFFNSNPDI